MAKTASNSHNPCLPRDPDFLLSLKLIPPHLLRYIPKERRPGTPTRKQKDAIRNILNMRKDQPFRRCKGHSAKFIKAREAEGDFSHSNRKHLCPECQCPNVAGLGTKGDFYGIGALGSVQRASATTRFCPVLSCSMQGVKWH